MVSRLKNCSDFEIITILSTDSDSNEKQKLSDCNATSNVREEGKPKIQNTAKNILDISSDTENVFQRNKYALSKNKILEKKKVSLKIKLRRSTEQSLYKIDTDSEHERLTPKSHSRVPRQRKKSYSEVDSEGSCSDSKDNSLKNRASSNNEMETEEVGNTRIRRPPLRFSSYHCDTLPSLRPPSLRSRRNVNYNEDKLFINSLACNIKNDKESSMRKESSRTPDSSSQLKLNNSNVKNNKRNRIPSIKGDENDSGTDSKAVKAKSLKKSNNYENSTNDKLSDTSKIEETTKKQDALTEASVNTTPVKLTRQKRVMCENTQKNVQKVQDNEGNNEEECLSDMYKRIKISSAIKSCTPKRINKQKGIICKRIDAQFVNENKSNEEEEDLANMCTCIKISSVKKSNLTPQKRNNTKRNLELQLEEAHLSTPRSRLIKCSSLTPSMGKRHSTLLKPTTPLQEARSRLHVSAVPKSLPCREEEFNNIFTFLRGKLQDKSGGCIYISGVPGTGKTATVNEAVRCLQKLIFKGQLGDFDYAAINGMKLTEPRQAYVQILKQLDGKTLTWEQSYRVLEKRFHSTASKMTLLLVDELDFLCTKRQDVVYNLLDWPTKSTAQLVVITIANTMDLPERVLMGRVTSRLGLTRLTFQPYNYKQLQEIVTSRLKDFDGFRNEAVQLVARKVSAVSGDARRALDICRRAMEIAETRNAKTISLQDVTEAVSEMIASAKVQAIKHCSKMEQVFLQAVAAEVTRTSIEEVYFKDAYKQLESLCSFDGIEIPSITETLAVCGRLGANRLLICEHSRNDIYQKILLNVSTDDIHYAVQQLDLNLK